MKNIARTLLSFFISVQMFSQNVSFAETSSIDYYTAQLSAIIQKYDSDDYFSSLTVKIGDTELVKDGERISIDNEGSKAYVENGRTMMPVRAIAEAIGAEVSYDQNTRTVTLENEDTVVAMTIGENEMEVNGRRVTLLNAPEIRKDRTMLPIRDVAEALDCEVEWHQASQTATFTKNYQTKRVIVHSEYADTTNAVEYFKTNNKTILQFDNIDDAKACVEANLSKGIIAEPDYIRKVESLSWGAANIGGDNYYYQTNYAAGSSVVAVVDTGIDYDHEFLENHIISGYDFYHDDNYAEDERGHGTAVASTVIDIAGKNPNIKIMPLKVFGKGENCSSLTISAAIKYAADNGADVINLSLGGKGTSYEEQDAINYANNHNIAVVASAGNDEIDLQTTPYSPATLDGVITVSAINQNNHLAYFSNYGNGVVDFAAPGVNIKCAKNGGGYTTMDGTSFSAPHVAGVYALVKAVHPDMTTADITYALSRNAVNIGSSRYFGAGRIYAKSLERYLSGISCYDFMASDITSTNATLRAYIGYSGIIPEKVGVKINGKEVYSTSFKRHSNNHMNFSCNLANDANYTLKPETTYEAVVFTNQGSYILTSNTLKFTTNKAAEIPTPTPKPTPTPEASTLRIIPDKYPTYDLEQGSKFNLSGRIKSNYHITDVRSYILDSNKNIVQQSSGWTSTSTYVIENSQLDTGLKFENLSPGTYYLKYYAKDKTGNTVSWTSTSFKIKGVTYNPPSEPTVSGVVLIPDSFDNLSIRTGPSTGYNIVGSMDNKVRCNVYTNKSQNGWYYIEYNGVYGYAAGNYIYLPSETRTGIVNIPSNWDNLSIRTGPSTGYDIVGSMNHGVKCTVFPDKASNGWYYVEYNGTYGYAAGNRIYLQ